MYSVSMSYSAKHAFFVFFVVCTVFVSCIAGNTAAQQPSSRQTPLDTVTPCLINQYATLTRNGLECVTTPSYPVFSCSSDVTCCAARQFVRITPEGLRCSSLSDAPHTCATSDCSDCPDCCRQGAFAIITATGLECIQIPAWLSIRSQTVRVGNEFSLELSDKVLGVPTPTLSVVGVKPAWLSLTGTELTGDAPSSRGEHRITIRARNRAGYKDKVISVTVIDSSPQPITEPIVCNSVCSYSAWTPSAGDTCPGNFVGQTRGVLTTNLCSGVTCNATFQEVGGEKACSSGYRCDTDTDSCVSTGESDPICAWSGSCGTKECGSVQQTCEPSGCRGGTCTPGRTRTATCGTNNGTCPSGESCNSSGECVSTSCGTCRANQGQSCAIPSTVQCGTSLSSISGTCSISGASCSAPCSGTGTQCPSGESCNSSGECVSDVDCTNADCTRWNDWTPAQNTYCGSREQTRSCRTVSPSGCSVSNETRTRTGTKSCSHGCNVSTNRCNGDPCDGVQCSTWGSTYSPSLDTFCGSKSVTQYCSNPSDCNLTRDVPKTGTLSCNSCQRCSSNSCVSDSSRVVNCSWNSWGSWTPAQNTYCGSRTQTRSRTSNPARCGGSSCSGVSSGTRTRTGTKSCNSCQKCSSNSCVSDSSRVVNCSWNSWGSWTPAQNTYCGSRTQTRSRTSNPARCGGSSCSGVSSGTRTRTGTKSCSHGCNVSTNRCNGDPCDGVQCSTWGSTYSPHLTLSVAVNR